MKRIVQIHDFANYEDGKDYNIQCRNCRPLEDGTYWFIHYCWKSDENLEYYCNPGCFFKVGDKIKFTYRGCQMTAKIDMVDLTYYGGTCPVIYSKATKPSSKKLTAYNCKVSS